MLSKHARDPFELTVPPPCNTCTCTCINFRFSKTNIHVSFIINYFIDLIHFILDLYSNENITTLLDVYSDLSNTETVSSLSTNIHVVHNSPLKTQAQSTPCDGIPNIIISDACNDDEGTECRRLCAYNIPVSW